jgi:hypothetical protein
LADYVTVSDSLQVLDASVIASLFMNTSAFAGGNDRMSFRN